MNRFRYAPEDVDCKLCTNYPGKRNPCAACPWLAERMEAGMVGYREAVCGSLPDWFKEADRKKLEPRIDAAIAAFPGSLFPDKEHEKRMEDAKARVGLRRKRDTTEYFAAMFLLTASGDLSRRSMDCYGHGGISFQRVELRGISPEDYALLAAAKGLYNGNFCPDPADLADAEVIDDKTFALILNALLLAKYGSDALSIRETENRAASP